IRVLVLVAAIFGTLALFAAQARAAAPVNTSPPTISGTPRQGETLTAQNGSWQNSPTSFQYQWERCDTSGAGCVNIAGATEKTRVLTGADAGHTIRVRVTAVNADGSAGAQSAPTAVVAASAAVPKNTSPPTI